MSKHHHFINADKAGKILFMVVSEDASRQGQVSRLHTVASFLFNQALSQWKMKEKLHVLRTEISVARKTKGD